MIKLFARKFNERQRKRERERERERENRFSLSLRLSFCNRRTNIINALPKLFVLLLVQSDVYISAILFSNSNLASFATGGIVRANVNVTHQNEKSKKWDADIREKRCDDNRHSRMYSYRVQV